MALFLVIFKFLVLTVYYFFLWDTILNIKSELFDKDKEDRDSLLWLYLLCFVYAFFNCGLIIKVLHL